jgi:hypothetical protein
MVFISYARECQDSVSWHQHYEDVSHDMWRRHFKLRPIWYSVLFSWSHHGMPRSYVADGRVRECI